MERAVIVDVEATPTRLSKEEEAIETTLARSQNRFGPKPNRIAGDVAYGTGISLGGLLERKIAPHIPTSDKDKRNNGTLSRGDFSFDMYADVYS